MKEIRLEALVSNIPEVTAFVDEELEAHDCPMKAQIQIDIAIDEIFSNIAKYAYAPDSGDAVVRISFEEDPRAAVLTFIDRGIPYNPLEEPAPDISLPAEEREIGGLGLLVVKKSMDEMSYVYEDGENRLTLKKYI